MDETDNRNEELKSDLHENAKVRAPVVEKPDGSIPGGREAVKEVIGISSDLESRGVDKTGISAVRDSQGLNSVLEYTSKIRAFIGLEDDNNDDLSGFVENSKPDEEQQLCTELDVNATDFMNGENEPIGNVLGDEPGSSSKIVSSESDHMTDDKENGLVDNGHNHLIESSHKNESTKDGTCVGNEQGKVFAVDTNLSNLTFNENLICADKGLKNHSDKKFEVDDNNSNFSLENSDVEEDQVNNNENIYCNILIKNNDSRKLIDDKNNLLDCVKNVKELDACETKDDCNTADNALNRSENVSDIVVDQLPLNDDIKSLVLESSFKTSGDGVNLIQTDKLCSIDLNDSQTILRDELAENDILVTELGNSVEVVKNSTDLNEDIQVKVLQSNGDINFPSDKNEESHPIMNEESNASISDEKDNYKVCLKEQVDEQLPSLEHIRRLSCEIVSRVLDSAENQLKDILEESQKSTVNTNELAFHTTAAEKNTIIAQFNDDFQTSNTNSSKMIGNSSSKDFNSLNSQQINNKPVKEINLKDVLTNTYDSKDFMKKIEIEMNKFHPEFDVDPDTICGIGSFKPQWLQPWATAKVYLVLYSIIGILSGTYYSYLISCISTLEKRFAFKSKVSGSIMMIDEITPLLLGVLIGYFGGRTHRPRMVAFGMFLSCLCCFVSALPYFIYGAATHLNSVSLQNTTKFEVCESTVRSEDCDSDDRPPTLAAILFLMLGSFLKGFGNLAYYAVGLAYMDDNAKKQNTPMYFAVAFSLRLLGPLIGFLMSSAFLKYHENPFDDPGFGPEDPRWIGAWWMGFVLQGILLAIFTFPIALFPKRLPGHKAPGSNSKSGGEAGVLSNFAGLFAAMKRLGKNPLFIFIVLNTIMSIYGSFGHYIMLPKYMENQFRLSASQASLLSGPPGIAALIVSTLIGGYLIYRFKPNAKFLTGGMMVLEIVGAVGFLLLMIPQCETIQMSNSGWDGEGLILEDSFNANCSCSTTAFTPVCAPDGKTHYFSPCFAGCRDKINETFTNCSLVENLFGPEKDYVTEGFCLVQGCWSQTLAYIITLPTISLIVSVLRVAHTMVLLRSIKTEDKSVALGTFETFLSAFGFIPYPVVFGALIDSACLVWEKSCGKTGNCWFYDVPKFNYLLHGASALFSGLSALCLFVVFCLSGRVNDLYEEDEEDVVVEKQKGLEGKRHEEEESSVTKF